MSKDKRLPEPFLPSKEPPTARHPLFGALKGEISIPAGIDLTDPADPDWGKTYEQFNRP
jgi:hypothetical protein